MDGDAGTDDGVGGAVPGAFDDIFLIGEVFHTRMQGQMLIHLVLGVPSQGIVGIQLCPHRITLKIAASGRCRQPDTGGQSLYRRGVDVSRPCLAGRGGDLSVTGGFGRGEGAGQLVAGVPGIIPSAGEGDFHPLSGLVPGGVAVGVAVSCIDGLDGILYAGEEERDGETVPGNKLMLDAGIE